MVFICERDAAGFEGKFVFGADAVAVVSVHQDGVLTIAPYREGLSAAVAKNVGF